MKTLFSIFALVLLVLSAPVTAQAYPGESRCASNDDCVIVTVKDACGRNKSACFNSNDDMDAFRQSTEASYKGKKPSCKAKPATIPDCYCAKTHKCAPAKHALMH